MRKRGEADRGPVLTRNLRHPGRKSEKNPFRRPCMTEAIEHCPCGGGLHVTVFG